MPVTGPLFIPANRWKAPAQNRANATALTPPASEIALSIQRARNDLTRFRKCITKIVIVICCASRGISGEAFSFRTQPTIELSSPARASARERGPQWPGPMEYSGPARWDGVLPISKTPDSKETILCNVHGPQQPTLVCQHIVSGLVAKERVGFWWTREDPDNPRPDAWCTACKERLNLNGGEWTGEVLELAKPQNLCGVCYDLARKFHTGGNPWS